MSLLSDPFMYWCSGGIDLSGGGDVVCTACWTACIKRSEHATNDLLLHLYKFEKKCIQIVEFGPLYAGGVRNFLPPSCTSR